MSKITSAPSFAIEGRKFVVSGTSDAAMVTIVRGGTDEKDIYDGGGGFGAVADGKFSADCMLIGSGYPAKIYLSDNPDDKHSIYCIGLIELIALSLAVGVYLQKKHKVWSG